MIRVGGRVGQWGPGRRKNEPRRDGTLQNRITWCSIMSGCWCSRLAKPSKLHIWEKDGTSSCLLCSGRGSLEHLLSSGLKAQADSCCCWRHDQLSRAVAASFVSPIDPGTHPCSPKKTITLIKAGDEHSVYCCKSEFGYSLCWWVFASCGMACTLLFSKSSLVSRLWYLHPLPSGGWQWFHWLLRLSSFTAFTMLMSSTAVDTLGWPVLCLLVSLPVVSVFFRTFQIVVLAIPNGCAIALNDFPSSFNFKTVFIFSHRPLSSLHVCWAANAIDTCVIQSQKQALSRV